MGKSEENKMLDEALNTVDKSIAATNIEDVLTLPVIDRVIRELTDYRNPIRQNLPRKKGSGQSYAVIRYAAGATPATFVSDTGTITEDTGSRTRHLFPYKTIATQGKVSRKAQREGAQFMDLLKDEIVRKTKAFKDYEDKVILKGSGTSNQFTGLDLLLNIADPGGNVVAQTTSGLGEALSAAKLDEMLDKSTTEIDMIICSKSVKRQINALSQSLQRFVDKIEVKGGFKLISWNDIPIYTSSNVPNIQHFGGVSGKCGISAEVGGCCSTIYGIDTDECFMAVLTEVTAIPLAKISSQYDEFDIYCDEVLVVGNTQSCAALIGIKV